MKHRTSKTPRRSRILEEMLETARDLHRLGLISDDRLRLYERLALKRRE